MATVKEVLETTINERIKRYISYRGGKRKIRFTSVGKPGYKIKMVKGRPIEVRMSPQEIRKRKMGRRRAAPKIRSKKTTAARKRKQTMRKRGK